MLPVLCCFSSSPGAPWGERCDVVLWAAASTGQVRTWVFQSMMGALRFRGVGDTKNIRERLWALSELCSPNLLAHSASLSSGPAVPGEHRKHRGEVTVGLQPSRWCVLAWTTPLEPSQKSLMLAQLAFSTHAISFVAWSSLLCLYLPAWASPRQDQTARW